MPDPIDPGASRPAGVTTPGPETAADPKGATTAPGQDTKPAVAASDGAAAAPALSPEEQERQKNFHDLYERKQREWSEQREALERRAEESESQIERLMGLLRDPRARGGAGAATTSLPPVDPQDPAYPIYAAIAALGERLESVDQRLGHRDNVDQAGRAQQFIDDFASREKFAPEQKARLERLGVAIRKGDHDTLLRAVGALIREEDTRAKADREAFIAAAVEADRNGRRDTVRAGATAAGTPSLGAPPVDWSEKSDKEFRGHLADAIKDSEAFLRARGLPIPSD